MASRTAGSSSTSRTHTGSRLSPPSPPMATSGSERPEHVRHGRGRPRDTMLGCFSGCHGPSYHWFSSLLKVRTSPVDGVSSSVKDTTAAAAAFMGLVQKAFQLALLCTKRHPIDRPTMHEVAWVLLSLMPAPALQGPWVNTSRCWWTGCSWSPRWRRPSGPGSSLTRRRRWPSTTAATSPPPPVTADRQR